MLATLRLGAAFTPHPMASLYTGRFAPSPTGHLHFGSLVTALASYLDARVHHGRWLVRMEDIDPPREIPGAASHILRQLETHGLLWDGEALFQSRRLDYYQDILASLWAAGRAYSCDCTRQAVHAMGGVYDGHCRNREGLVSAPAAVRVRVADAKLQTFEDIFQGAQQQRLDTEVGDFVVQRKDGLPAYQLAVVADDCAQGITHVIRGMDLLDSTPRQIWLMAQLDHPSPQYGHLPLALNHLGQKLSKQNHALDIDRLPPVENLRLAMAWLGISSPLEGDTVEDLLAVAIQGWRRDLVVGQICLPAPECYRVVDVSLAGGAGVVADHP